MFSRRTDHEREPNTISADLARARASGRRLYDLTVANPTEVGLGLEGSALFAPLRDEEAARYAPTALGRLETREAVAARVGTDASRVVLTASTSEAYAQIFAVLCDPGDRVLVPRPSYPLLEWLAKFSGVEIAAYELVYDGEWYVDLDSVDRAIDERTRAIVVVSPNNPTGSLLDEATRDALLDRGLPLVVDEVFAGFPLDRETLPELPRARRGLEFRLSGLSKQVALPQMKLAFATVDGEAGLVDEAIARLAILSDTFLSTSTPIELAAPSWLAHGPGVRAQITARCRANLASLDAALAAGPATRLRADGGWYATIRVPDVIDEDAYCAALLEDGVVAQPGWFYDFTNPAYLVVSLLPREDDFREAVSRVARTLARVSGQALR